MAGFSNHADYVKAYQEGKTYLATWRKLVTQTATSGIWFDLSMSAGNPRPQYYAASPLVSQQLRRSTDGGFDHGPNVSPKSKFLSRFSIMTTTTTPPVPLSYILCDYLMFYPFLDMGSTDEQPLENTVTLPRYESGEGVQMMLVSVAPGSSTFPNVVVNYTNSNGVAGRVTPQTTLLGATGNGTIPTSGSTSGLNAHSWNFIGLQAGDKGVRSVQSVTVTANPDVSLMSLVLVKPLVTGCLLEQTSPHEINCLADNSNMPRIYDDAFLSLIVLPQVGITALSSLIGEIEVIFD